MRHAIGEANRVPALSTTSPLVPPLEARGRAEPGLAPYHPRPNRKVRPRN